MTTFLLDTAAASTATNSTQQQGGIVGTLISLLPMILIIVVFYFLLIRPQRKRDKQIQDMRNSLQVGDEIITSGGIVGLVVSIKDDNVVIETGSDRSKVRIKRWAVQSNETIHENQESK